MYIEDYKELQFHLWLVFYGSLPKEGFLKLFIFLESRGSS